MRYGFAERNVSAGVLEIAIGLHECVGELRTRRFDFLRCHEAHIAPRPLRRGRQMPMSQRHDDPVELFVSMGGSVAVRIGRKCLACPAVRIPSRGLSLR